MSQPTSYQITPDQQSLAEIERRLAFHPSPVQHPATLTSEQVAQYNRDGYIKGIRIFDGAEIASLRAYFDDLLARVIAAGGDSYSISTAHRKYGRVYDVLTHPKIVACVRDLLGDNVVAWGSHFFCKMPHDGKTVSWHQDSSYWPLTPSKTATVWLAVDDADVENACMQFIPGSQHFGHLTYHLSETSENNVLDQTVKNADQLGKPIDVELRAGEVSIHSDLLLHGSKANNSDRRRCGLTLRYCAADVRAHLDWSQKGVIVSGSDPTGHWSNQPRPTED